MIPALKNTAGSALLATLAMLIAPAALADAPDGDAAFAMLGATHPVLDLGDVFAGGGPIPFSFDDPDLGAIDVELTAALIGQDLKGRMAGTATVNEAAGSPLTVTLDCEIVGKVRGKEMITKLIVLVRCDGDIDAGIGFGAQPAEVKLKLAYLVDQELDETVEKKAIKLKIAGVPFGMSEKQVLPGVPAFFPPALDWDLDVTIAPDPSDPSGNKLLGIATATLWGGASTIDFEGAGSYKPNTDVSVMMFKSPLQKGVFLKLKKAVVNPGWTGPSDYLESYDLRYKIMGQKGTLIVPPPPVP
jgi:hypothetical protein